MLFKKLIFINHEAQEWNYNSHQAVFPSLTVNMYCNEMNAPIINMKPITNILSARFRLYEYLDACYNNKKPVDETNNKIEATIPSTMKLS